MSISFVDVRNTTSNLASSSDYIFEETNASSSSKIPITCPSLAELNDAIQTLKLTKAAGEDDIADPQTSAEILHPHIAAVWEN